MNHFQKEVHPRKAIYHALNRMRSGGTTNDKKKTGRPTSWTPDRKSQLQRLAYNRKVRGSHFFIYINDCFHPPASPRVIFLASFSHYSRETVAWEDENVNIVPEKINPPNVPHARPIENFHVFLAQKVYEGGTEQQLIRRIEF